MLHAYESSAYVLYYTYSQNQFGMEGNIHDADDFKSMNMTN